MVWRYRNDLKRKARTPRSNMTEAEQLLWSRLRRKQVHGVPFYRQRPLGNYMVDFYAPRARLVVELDGSQHMTTANTKRDSRRDAFLQMQRLTVLRYDNLQVLKETDAVMEAISPAVRDAGASAARSAPSPLCKRGEREGI